jgi:hypothetical protein
MIGYSEVVSEQGPEQSMVTPRKSDRVRDVGGVGTGRWVEQSAFPGTAWLVAHSQERQ